MVVVVEIIFLHSDPVPKTPAIDKQNAHLGTTQGIHFHYFSVTNISIDTHSEVINQVLSDSSNSPIGNQGPHKSINLKPQ